MLAASRNGAELGVLVGGRVATQHGALKQVKGLALATGVHRPRGGYVCRLTYGATQWDSD